MGLAPKLPLDAELGAQPRTFARDRAAGRARNLPVSTNTYRFTKPSLAFGLWPVPLRRLD